MATPTDPSQPAASVVASLTSFPRSVVASQADSRQLEAALVGATTPHREPGQAPLARARARLQEARRRRDRAEEASAAQALARALAERDQELETALMVARRALSLREDAALRGELSAWLQGLGDHAAAAQELRRGLEGRAGGAAARGWARVGEALARSGDAAGAAEALREALSHEPSALVREVRGAVAFWAPEQLRPEVGAAEFLDAARLRGRADDGALEDRLRALELVPGLAAAIEAVVESLTARGRAGAADEVLRGWAEGQGEGAAEVHRRRVRAALAARDVALALGAALEGGFDERGGDDGGTFDVLLDLSGLHDLLVARMELRAEASAGEERVELYADLARMLGGPLARPAQAAVAWAQVLDEAPGHAEADEALRALGGAPPAPDEASLAAQLGGELAPAQMAAARLSLCRAARRRGDRAEALHQALQVLDRLPEQREALAMTAALGALLGNAPAKIEAMAALGKGLAPAVAATLLAWASRATAALGDAERSRRLAERASHADPSLPSAAAALASSLRGARDRVAAAALERSAALGVLSGSLCGELVDIHLALGQLSQALGWAQRRLLLRPGDPHAVGALLRLASAVADPEKLEEAIDWVSALAIPAATLAEPLGEALAALGSLDAGRARSVARKVLDALGPALPPLRRGLLSVAEQAGDDALAAAALERWAVGGCPPDQKAAAWMEQARKRRRADPLGAARALARALKEGTPADEVSELASSLRGHDPEAQLALLEVRAEALSALGAGRSSEAAALWREAGAARWDWAEDRAGMVRAWVRAAELEPIQGPARLVRDLFAFAGPAVALEELFSHAEQKKAPREAAHVLSLAALAALLAGEPRRAFDAAERAMQLDPVRAEALAVAERAADVASDLPRLDALYASLAAAAKGKFGRRAAHYRAARTLEAWDQPSLAVPHALQAFEQVPSLGTPFALMMRLASRAGMLDQAIEVLGSVASRARSADERWGWFRRAADACGDDDEGRRQRADLLLRALRERADRRTIEATADALAELVHEHGDPLDLTLDRLLRAQRSILDRVEGPDGARCAIFFAAASLRSFQAGTPAVEALRRALDCDADLDEYALLLPQAEALAEAELPDPSVGLVERCREILRRPFANVGAPALRLCARVALLRRAEDAASDLLLRAAKRFDDDEGIRSEVALALTSIADEQARDALARAYPDVLPESPEAPADLAAVAPSAEITADAVAASDAAAAAPAARGAAFDADATATSADEAAALEAIAAVAAAPPPARSPSAPAPQPAAASAAAARSAPPSSPAGHAPHPPEVPYAGTAAVAALAAALVPDARPTPVLGSGLPGGRPSWAPNAPESIAAEGSWGAADAPEPLPVSTRRTLEPAPSAELDERSVAQRAVLAARQQGDAGALAEALARLAAFEDDRVARRELLRELAPLLLELGDRDGARGRWSEALDLDPADRDALQALEQIAMDSGDYAALAQILQKRAVASSDPEEVRVLRLRRAALLEQRLGRINEARGELELLLQQGEDPSATRFLADLLERQGAFIEAGAQWMRAFRQQVDPRDRTDLAIRAAQAFAKAGELDQARTSLDAALLLSRSERLLELRVEIERAAGNHRGLADALDELAIASMAAADRRAEFLVEASRASLAAGDESAALERAQRAARIAPHHADAQLLARNLEYRARGAGTPQEAAQTIEDLRRVSGSVPLAQLPLHSFLLAEALDVLHGNNAGIRELSARHAEIGAAPLLALGLAERLSRVSNFQASLPFYDTALAGDLLGLRRRGSVALAAAEAAQRLEEFDQATRYLHEATLDPATAHTARQRQAALDQLQRSRSEALATDPRRALQELALRAVGLERARILAQLARLTAAIPAERAEADRLFTEAIAAAYLDQPLRMALENERDALRGISRSSNRPPPPAGASAREPSSRLPRPSTEPSAGAPARPSRPPSGSGPRPPASLAAPPTMAAARSSAPPPEPPSLPTRPAPPPSTPPPYAALAKTMVTPGVAAPPQPDPQSMATIPPAGTPTIAAPPPSAPPPAPSAPPPAPTQLIPRRSSPPPSARIASPPPPPIEPTAVQAPPLALPRLTAVTMTEATEAPMSAPAPRSQAEVERVTIVPGAGLETRQRFLIDPTSPEPLRILHDAALSDHNPVYARALEHVLNLFSPGAPYVPPPPLAAQREEPDAVHRLLSRGTGGAACEALGLVWEHASQLFRRDAGTYGVTGLDRVALSGNTVACRVYSAAAHVLGASRTPLFQRRSHGPVAATVALLTPPAVVLSGDPRDETPELLFRLGAAFAAAWPEQALAFGLPEMQLRSLLSALTTAFGPPPAVRVGSSSVAALAGSLWQALPARAQRRMHELCAHSAEFTVERAQAAARRVSRRAGLFLCGDLGVALREALADDAPDGRPIDSFPALADACGRYPYLVDLLALAISPEYADARWRPGDPRARRAPSGNFRMG